MKYALIVLLVVIGTSNSFAEDLTQACPVTMDGREFYGAGGRLKLKSNVPIVYPSCELLGCGDGKVVLQSVILTDGSQTDISVVENSYKQDLQQDTTSAALKSASQMTYEPPTVNGKPVCVRRPIQFHWITK